MNPGHTVDAGEKKRVTWRTMKIMTIYCQKVLFELDFIAFFPVRVRGHIEFVFTKIFNAANAKTLTGSKVDGDGLVVPNITPEIRLVGHLVSYCIVSNAQEEQGMSYNNYISRTGFRMN